MPGQMPGNIKAGQSIEARSDRIDEHDIRPIKAFAAPLDGESVRLL
jgi:hypothetical protein